MTNLECQFIFHPIGQGLFYSGQINDFGFVYDCGSSSGTQYLKSALESFDVKKSPLDLLIISHFHEDHMNAVESLLAKTKGVKQVILPYLFPSERLMVAAGYALANGLDNLNENYIAFLVDPVAYLRERSAPESAIITLLLSGAAETEWQNPQEQPVGEYGWFPPNLENKENYPDLNETPSSVELRKHSSIYRVPLWGFKFYCQPGRATREEIEHELNHLEKPIKTDDIAIVIRERLKELKDVYYSLFNGSAGQNETSIVCCHGPAIPRNTSESVFWGKASASLYSAQCPRVRKRWRGSSYMYKFLFGYYEGFKIFSRSRLFLPPLQILTGDANLKLAEYRTHFKEELDSIGLMQLPHHGSKRNWRNDFPSLMPNCSLWVASFGLGNQYKHPSKFVVDAIASASRQMILCSEMQGFTIHADCQRVP